MAEHRCHYSCHFCKVYLTWANASWMYCICCDNYDHGHEECFKAHDQHHSSCKNHAACAAEEPDQGMIGLL